MAIESNNDPVQFLEQLDPQFVKQQLSESVQRTEQLRRLLKLAERTRERRKQTQSCGESHASRV